MNNLNIDQAREFFATFLTYRGEKPENMSEEDFNEAWSRINPIAGIPLVFSGQLPDIGGARAIGKRLSPEDVRSALDDLGISGDSPWIKFMLKSKDSYFANIGASLYRQDHFLYLQMFTPYSTNINVRYANEMTDIIDYNLDSTTPEGFLRVNEDKFLRSVATKTIDVLYNTKEIESRLLTNNQIEALAERKNKLCELKSGMEFRAPSFHCMGRSDRSWFQGNLIIHIQLDQRMNKGE